MEQIIKFNRFTLHESNDQAAKSVGQFIYFINHLRCAKEYIDSIIRDKPNTIGAQLARKIKIKIDSAYTELITSPALTDNIRQQIRSEWNSDTFAISALQEKIALLKPEQRDLMEKIIDSVLKGEEIKIVD